MTRLAGVLVVLLLASCEPEQPPPPPPPNPPQVFLTVTESNVIGDAVRGKVNVSGCKAVAQLQILQGDAFLSEVTIPRAADGSPKLPADFTLTAGLFAPLYSRLGIAASLSLKAKAICDDGRTNNSQPVGVKFFPIAGRFQAADGSQVVPNNFVAEGGLGGTANAFIGCVLTNTGTTIARVNNKGEVLTYVGQMPFDCSLSTSISEVSTVTGTRWVFEPGVGVFAFRNSDFQVQKSFVNDKVKRIGVGKKGQAVIWIDDGATRNRIRKLDPVPSVVNEWEAPFLGIMNSDPLIDDGAGQSVWVTRFLLDIGTKRADIIPWQYDLNTGTVKNGIVNGEPAVILRQQYPIDVTSEPIIPQGVFSPDGSFFTIPAYSFDTAGNFRTTVLSCSTAGGLCEGAARRWTSPTFVGGFRMVLPFAEGNMYAVVGPFAVYFLNGQSGTIINLGEQPITPSGSLIVVGVQPGAGTDFYVLTGPNLGAAPSWPMEIIAVDSPSTGEVWRLEFGSGEDSANAMYMAIDDARQPWIRAGLDLIKPLPMSEYRMARGPTVLP